MFDPKLFGLCLQCNRPFHAGFWAYTGGYDTPTQRGISDYLWCSHKCLRAWLNETAHERGIHWSAQQKWYEERIQLGRFGVN